MYSATFYLDILDELHPDHPTFDGYTNGTLWNGFATPFFTFDVATRLIECLADIGQTAGYNAEVGVFYVDANNDGDVEEWAPLEMLTDDGAKTLYAIGAFSWVWGTLDIVF